MHAVDRHDQLRETFSLAKRHGFKKYYQKVAMGLLDMAAVNAWLHFKLVHKDLCEKKSARYEFMNSLADALIHTNWKEFPNTQAARDNENIFKLLLDDSNDSSDNRQLTCEDLGEFQSDNPSCQPVLVASFLGERRKKRTGLCCQVCAFEGKGKGCLRSVVICVCHRLRLCTIIRPTGDKEEDGADDSWRAPSGMSCWSKAHSFTYQKDYFLTV